MYKVRNEKQRKTEKLHLNYVNDTKSDGGDLLHTNFLLQILNGKQENVFIEQSLKQVTMIKWNKSDFLFCSFFSKIPTIVE